MADEQLTATLAALYHECIEGVRNHDPREVWQRRLQLVKELQEQLKSLDAST
jgi:hypothetical protein